MIPADCESAKACAILSAQKGLVSVSSAASQADEAIIIR
jgi:hypothetical protein